MNKKFLRPKMRKLSERVSATKNIVVEFCPADNCPEFGRPNDREKAAIIRGVPRKNVSKKKSPTLPKLKAVASSTTYESKKSINLEFSMPETLPGIKKKENSNIFVEDREVDRIKSKWQLLKEDKNWQGQRSKMTGSQMKKLHETLQRLSKNEEIQRSCSEKLKSECCSQSETSDVMKNPRIVRFEDEIARMREEIFPRRREAQSGGDASLEELQKRLRREKTTGVQLKPSTLEMLKKSLLDEKKSIKMLERSGSSFERKNSGGKINEEIENFINKYDARGNKGHDKEPEVREPSSDQVAEILAKLKIDDSHFCRYSDEDNCEDFPTPRLYESEEYSEMEKIIESRDFGTEMNEKTPPRVDLEKHQEQEERFKNIATGMNPETLANGAGQELPNESSRFLPDSETFLKIGLSDSQGQIPNCFLSGILKSNYLRNGPDLKPI